MANHQKIRLITQPFADSANLQEFLLSQLADTAITTIDMVVAWVKRSGLEKLGKYIDQFRRRGGKLRIITGIDQGGATRQGLQLAMSLADEAYVYHVNGRTFHPKLYLAYGASHGQLLIGSANLTGGGLTTNFEVGVQMAFSPVSTEGSALIKETNEYIGRLLTDTGACRQLTAQLLSELVSDVRYAIGDEDVAPPAHNVAGANASSSGSDLMPPIFGKSHEDFKKGTGSFRAGSNTGALPITSLGALSAHRAGSPSHRWYKKMSKADAQRPSSGTNPTGHLTLTQASHPIDHTTYFRKVLFEGLAWTKVDGSGRIRASAMMRVTVNGKVLGDHVLQIDHNPAYEASQGNRTTTLRWGEKLNAFLHSHDMTGQFVTIERYSDGTFLLEISTHPRGGFISRS